MADGLDWETAKPLILQHESNNTNILQSAYNGEGINPSTGTHTPPSSASGYFQITDSTWKNAAKTNGVDLSQYPTAMSAPYEVQEQVAKDLFNREGLAPWAPYNAKLAKDTGWTSSNSLTSNASNGLGSTLKDVSADLRLPLASNQLMPTNMPALSPDQITSLTAPPPPQLSTALALMQLLARGQHKIEPVDYDPFKGTKT